MIYISNNCLDGWVDRYEHQKYLTFTASLSMTVNNFLKLVEHIDDNDLFDNYQILRDNVMVWKTKDKETQQPRLETNIPYILLKNEIRLNAIHFAKYTDQEIKERFEKRIQRFKDNIKEGICFLFVERWRIGYDIVEERDIKNFDSIITQHPKYIVTNKVTRFPKNSKVIYVNNVVPAQIYKEVYEKINNIDQSKTIGKCGKSLW